MDESLGPFNLVLLAIPGVEFGQREHLLVAAVLPYLVIFARVLNGERAVIVTVPSAGDAVMAAVHVETRGGRIVTLRVARDPRRLAHLA